MIAVLGTASLVCVVSLILGKLVLRIARLPGSEAGAPAAGFALLVILATNLVLLPGHGITAGIVLLLICVGSALFLLLSGTHPKIKPEALEPLTVMIATVFLASLAFIANGHFGLLGVSVNDDIAAHLYWADSLMSGRDLSGQIYPNYPIGPHALAAAWASLFRVPVDRIFTGILLAVPALAAATALGILGRRTSIVRLVAAVLAGLPYLWASFLAQGSFKELMQGLFFLGLASCLSSSNRGFHWSAGIVFPFALLIFAGVLVQGWPSAAWPLILISLWLMVSRLGIGQSTKGALTDISASVGQGRSKVWLLTVLTVLALPNVGRILSFRPPTRGGNVLEDLPFYQITGIALNLDFRIPYSERAAELLGVLGLCSMVYGLMWFIRRRNLTVPLAALTCAVLYAVIRILFSPYLAAKALVPLAPFAVLLVLRPFLDQFEKNPSNWRGIKTATASLLILTLLMSSVLALVSAKVGPFRTSDELGAVRQIVDGHKTIYLVADNYAYWNLRGALLSTPLKYSIPPHFPFPTRPEKTADRLRSFDFDSVTTAFLDKFEYAVTSKTAFASSVPPNWTPVLHTSSYQLWKRLGPTKTRRILREGSHPGRILDCSPPSVLTITPHSLASIRPVPILGKPSNWIDQSSGLPARPSIDSVALPLRGALGTILELPRGTWDISVQYRSDTGVLVNIDGRQSSLPKNLGLLGAFRHAATIQSFDRPVSVQLSQMKAASIVTRRPQTLIGVLAATEITRTSEMRPLERACGQYVDWFGTA